MNTIHWQRLPHLDPACPKVTISVELTPKTQTKLLEKHVRSADESWSLVVPFGELRVLRGLR